MSLHEGTAAARGPALVALDGRRYPLESARAEVHAESGIAWTRLVQRFQNPHDVPLEVLYTLALPADGAVLSYEIRIGETTFRSEIQTRAAAEEKYLRALDEGRTASLMEQERADTFTQRLGNVPARAVVEASIEVLHPLAFVVSGDESPDWEYRFPTVVGIRYEGPEGRVVDAPRLDVDRAEPGELPTRLELALTAAGVPGDRGAASPSHEIVSETSEGTVSVRFAVPAPLDRDVVVRWAAATPQIGLRLAEGRGLPGDEGRYALLTVVPPAVPSSAFRRDLTVLIDASGSMSGAPLALAKGVVSSLLGGLEAGDRFELLAFANEVKRLTPGLINFDSKSLAVARSKLERLAAGGGTEMGRAMREALEPLRPDVQRQVVLVTDGYIGFEADVMREVTTRLPEGSRLHAVGIGAAPNRDLLAGVARAGRGVEVIAGSVATAQDATQRLCAATARPVLTELAISGSALAHVAPRRPRDVFAGQPASVALELKAAGGEVEVRGRLADAADPWICRVSVPPQKAGEPIPSRLPIGALFGRERIADVEAAWVKIDRRASEGEIEAIALRHRIASRFTSLVAVAERPSVDPHGPAVRERLPVEIPSGVSAEGSGLLLSSMGGDMTLSGGPPTTARFRLAGTYLSARDMEVLREPARGMPPETYERLSVGAVHRMLLNAERIGLAGHTLTVRFEVPFSISRIPTGPFELKDDRGGRFAVSVEFEPGTPPAPWKTGTFIVARLTLTDGGDWSRLQDFMVFWSEEGVQRSITVRLIPARAGTP